MTGTVRRIAPLLVVLTAAALVQAAERAAERAADDAKPSPAASGKAATPAAPYEDADSIPAPAGGCCRGPKLVPVCRCVPTTKKKPKTEYEVECELVCVPGCGRHLFGKRHSDCSGCSSDGAGCCDQPCCDHATIRKKKTLLKKVVDTEEDAWEYKLEWVCENCADGGCPDGCSARVPSPPGRPWNGFHEFWRGLFHRK